MNRRALAAGAASAAALLLLSGCTGGGASADGRFAVALEADPGTLDPALTVSSSANQVNRFLYDTLTAVDAEGADVPQLAEEWAATTTEASFTLREGITCADGTELTASTVAENFAFIAEPENASPLLGFFVQPGTVVKADDDARTVTVTSGAPDAFLLRNLSSVPIVCQSGLDDRASLTSGSAGTGLFTLEESVSGDSYTLQRRDDYAWGPDGASGNESGLPESVVFRVLQGSSTATNLLLSGEINAARGSGPDADRLRGASLFETSYPNAYGQMFFNEATDRATTDEVVRRALVAGLDLDSVRKVMTGDEGVAPKGLIPVEPRLCEGDLVAGVFPEFDTEAAEKALDDAGWVLGSDGIRAKDGSPLTLTVLYAAGSGAEFDASMELVADSWRELGAKVELVAAGDSQIGQVLDETGEWDISFVPLGFTLPSQIVPFVSGPAPLDGMNSGHIDNPAYVEHATLAASLPGVEGCEAWNAAETALFSRTDVVPVADLPRSWFGKNAEFTLVAGQIVPTSIRLAG